MAALAGGRGAVLPLSLARLGGGGASAKLRGTTRAGAVLPPLFWARLGGKVAFCYLRYVFEREASPFISNGSHSRYVLGKWRFQILTEAQAVIQEEFGSKWPISLK